MSVPMQASGAFVGWAIPIVDCDGDLATQAGYYNTNFGFVSTTLPSGWTPYAAAGGGGGSTEVRDKFELHLPASTVLDGAYYPDWSVPGLADAERFFHASVLSPFTNGAWRQLEVNLYNVQANTPSPVQVTLRNLTSALTIATITIATSTGPATGKTIRSVAAIGSGTFVDGDRLQWQVADAPIGNAYGLLARAWFEPS